MAFKKSNPKEDSLSCDSLKERLMYNEDGTFTWVDVGRSKKVKVGDIAGGLNSHGYMTIKMGVYIYLQHRLAWLYVYGEWPGGSIDHKNRNRSDNSINNLRVLSFSDNGLNLNISSRNKSGTTGVCWYNRNNRWVSEIRVRGVVHNLGSYKNINDAIIARKMAEYELGVTLIKGE